ncbi:MAG: S8 family peptidase [Bacteroidota bacterium]
MKKLILIGLTFTTFTISYAQENSNSEVIDLTKNALKSWQHNNPEKDRYSGVSTNTALSKINNPNNFKDIVVAVMDGGTDIEHEDLKNNLWINTNEIAGNGIDDDHNGYIDDINGWNFIGGKNGDVGPDNTELTRLYKLGKENLPSQYSWKKIRKAYNKDVEQNKKMKAFVDDINNMFEGAEKQAGKQILKSEDLQNYEVSGTKMKLIKKAIANALAQGMDYTEIKNSLLEGKKQIDIAVNYHTNPNFECRSIVGDNYSNVNESNYGNNSVAGPDALHGTHVAGIIGAVRNNNLGMDGVADHVKLMVVRVVPDGDERDKDVANGIRYAVDNGAKIINMSFGKSYSPNKEAVDAAVKYAASKGVLIIHAAGNDNSNNDELPDYPNAKLSDGTIASNWIEVGASGPSGTAAAFSNYGKATVDLFAPGVEIYSCLPGSKYGNESGTSMACPVVAGVTALVWSYFPTLTAIQIRDAIINSVDVDNSTTPMPGKSKKIVPFNTLSKTGGRINAAKAVENAAKMSVN